MGSVASIGTRVPGWGAPEYRTAATVFAIPSVAPSEVEVAEVHDFPTRIELIGDEDLGFVDRSAANERVEVKAKSRPGGPDDGG